MVVFVVCLNRVHTCCEISVFHAGICSLIYFSCGCRFVVAAMDRQPSQQTLTISEIVISDTSSSKQLKDPKRRKSSKQREIAPPSSAAEAFAAEELAADASAAASTSAESQIVVYQETVVEPKDTW